MPSCAVYMIIERWYWVNRKKKKKKKKKEKYVERLEQLSIESEIKRANEKKNIHIYIYLEWKPSCVSNRRFLSISVSKAIELQKPYNEKKEEGKRKIQSSREKMQRI